MKSSEGIFKIVKHYYTIILINLSTLTPIHNYICIYTDISIILIHLLY